MLVFWSGGRPNVGDELNPWLWPRIAPPELTLDDEVEFFGIGSILTPDRLARTKKPKIIFGSGMRGPQRLAPDLLARCRIDFVRGPHSARGLDLPPSAAISDPAVLMPLHLKPSEGGRQPGRIGFVPHCSMPPQQAQQLAEMVGLVLIPPSQPVADFVNALCRCSSVLAEAMHGAILADAYRIPWIGCRLGSLLAEGRTNLFKWADWMDSLSIKAEPISAIPHVMLDRLHPRFARSASRYLTCHYASVMRRALAEGRWKLSRDEDLARSQDRISERVAALWHANCKSTAPRQWAGQQPLQKMPPQRHAVGTGKTVQ